MRIIAISDIHGRFERIQGILDAEKPADLIILAGDITDRGTPQQARDIVRLAQQHSPNVLAVAGNCDSTAIEKTLVEENVDLHTRTRSLLDWDFLGLSGVPSGMPWHYRFSEKQFAGWLEIMTNQTQIPHRRVLVTHTPPKGLRDRTHLRTHAGSRSVRKWLDQHSPALVVCGHIHEAHGHDRHGSTSVVNCGPALRGRYATIHLPDQASTPQISHHDSPTPRFGAKKLS